MKSLAYLQRLQNEKRLGVTELAKLLGMTQPAISNLLAGRRIMENETCVAIALALDIEPWPIIMAADMDRAERAGQHSLWEVFTARMATAVSVILAVCVTNFLTPSPAEAKQINDLQHSEVRNNLSYVKLVAQITGNKDRLGML